MRIDADSRTCPEHGSINVKGSAAQRAQNQNQVSYTAPILSKMLGRCCAGPGGAGFAQTDVLRAFCRYSRRSGKAPAALDVRQKLSWTRMIAPNFAHAEVVISAIVKPGGYPQLAR